MTMTNLLAETIADLQRYGKTPADVRFVVCDSQLGDWNDFAALADFEYDSGYGGNEINLGLHIVGDDWWLERGEYDGSEWWEYKQKPVRPDSSIPLTNLLASE